MILVSSSNASCLWAGSPGCAACSGGVPDIQSSSITARGVPRRMHAVLSRNRSRRATDSRTFVYDGMDRSLFHLLVPARRPLRKSALCTGTAGPGVEPGQWLLRPTWVLDREDVAVGVLEPGHPHLSRPMHVAFEGHPRHPVVMLECHALVSQLLHRLVHVLHFPERRRSPVRSREVRSIHA